MRPRTDQGWRPVVHVVSELRPGGVEIRLLELMRYLGAEAERHIILTVSGRKGSLAGEFEKLGVRVIPQKMRSSSYPAQFARVMISARPAAVQVYLNVTSGFQMLLAWCLRVPVRVTSFRSYGRAPATVYEALRGRVGMYLINRLSTDIIGVSPSTLDANLPNWRADPRCRVIVNGFPEGGERSEVGVSGPLPRGERVSLPVLVHVGRADIPSKNRERAISIVAALAELGQPHHLVFIGRHGATDQQASLNLSRWQRIAAERGVSDLVHFLGERMDVRALLRDADCLLVTSTLEGLPGVIVEALLEDTPVVASDIPGSAFLSQCLPGIRCLSLTAPDTEWAEAVLQWRTECADQVERRQLSEAVANSPFSLRRQVEDLRRLWGAHAS